MTWRVMVWGAGVCADAMGGYVPWWGEVACVGHMVLLYACVACWARGNVAACPAVAPL